MHVAFFTVRMRKGFGVDLCVDKWARGLLDPSAFHSTTDTTHMYNVKLTNNLDDEAVGNPELSRKQDNKAYADKVTVFCFDYDGDTYKDAPYEIIPLHLSRDKSNKILPIFESDALKTLGNLKKSLGAIGAFDLAIPASFPFYALKKVFDVPTVHLHFGNPPTFGLNPFARVNRNFLGYSDLKHMLRNDVVVSISDYLKSGLPNRQYEKTQTVYPGADHMPCVEKSFVQAMRERLIKIDSENTNDIFVLSVSRLDYGVHPYKGVMETVEIVNKLRAKNLKIRLVLAGIGSQTSIDNLSRLGAIVIEAPTFEELSALYQACDVFVSLSRWEGFGLPVAEAAFAGLPTVAYDTTAHSENAVSNLIKPYEDSSTVITELTSNAELRWKNGLLAKEIASRFTWERSCKGLVEIAKEVVS